MNKNKIKEIEKNLKDQLDKVKNFDEIKSYISLFYVEKENDPIILTSAEGEIHYIINSFLSFLVDKEILTLNEAQKIYNFFLFKINLLYEKLKFDLDKKIH